MSSDLVGRRGVEDVGVVVGGVLGRGGRVLVGAQHAVLRVGGHVHLLHLLGHGVRLDGSHVLCLAHSVVFHQESRSLFKQTPQVLF